MAISKRIPGIMLKLLGYFLLFVYLLCIWLPVKLHDGYFAIFIGVSLFPVALYFYRTGKKLLTPDIFKVLAADKRPPVLYLRSFMADSDKYPENNIGLRFLMMFGPFLNLRTVEEELKMAMDSTGPFVALGDPKESMPKLGAGRFYATDEKWKEVILKLIEDSRCIIIRADNTMNLWWEIEHAYKMKDTESIFFLLPGKEKKYNEFREIFCQVFPHISLPDFNPSANNKISGLFHISKDAKPIVQWTTTTFFERGSRKYLLASKLKNFITPYIGVSGIKAEQEKATAADRIKSTLIDIFILILFFIVCDLAWGQLIDGFIYVIALFLIPILSEIIFRTSIGKKIMRLKILDENHVPASAFQMFVRCYLKHMLFAILFYIFIPIMLVTGRFLYDKWSRTTVVKVTRA